MPNIDLAARCHSPCRQRPECAAAPFSSRHHAGCRTVGPAWLTALPALKASAVIRMVQHHLPHDDKQVAAGQWERVQRDGVPEGELAAADLRPAATMLP